MRTTRVFVILSLTTTPSRVFFMSRRLSRRPSDPQVALAKDGLGARQIALGLADPRRVLRDPHRELQPQVEELLGEVLDLLRELVASHVAPLDRFHASPSEHSRAGHKLGLDADLLGSEPEALAGSGLVDTLHLVQDPPGLDDGDPEFGIALTLPHPRLRGLFRHRLIREDPDEDLAPALHAARERDAGRLDLAIRHPPWLERLQPEVAEGERGAAQRDTLHAPPLRLAVLDSLGHQHGTYPSAATRWAGNTSPLKIQTFTPMAPKVVCASASP